MTTVIHTTDEKANFLVGTQGEIRDFLIANKETTDLKDIDYSIPLYRPTKSVEDANTLFDNQEKADIIAFEESRKIDNITNETTSVPMSFLQIKTIEDGYNWYKYYYPKYPDEVIRIMTRSQWGKPMTKKILKAEHKKHLKKEAKKHNPRFNTGKKRQPSLRISNKPILLTFQ